MSLSRHANPDQLTFNMGSMSDCDVVFTPALGSTLTVPADSSVACLYATSSRPVQLRVKSEDGATSSFEQIRIPSVGGLLTYKASIPITSSTPIRSTVSIRNADETPISNSSTFTLIRISSPQVPIDNEFTTCIVLKPSEDDKSVPLDWLNTSAWQGWAWERARPTWIEAEYVSPSLEALPDKFVHCLLLRPADTTEEGKKRAPDEVLAAFPASSRAAFVTLTGPHKSEGERPDVVYARVRRVGAVGEEVRVYVTGKLTSSSVGGENTAIHGAVQLARKAYELPLTPFLYSSGASWLDHLGFCTWSSIGENIPLTKANMSDLVQKLKKDAEDVPIGTFIIDDGWQDIRHGLNGHPKARGLWSFDTWDGMGCTLAELVSLIKDNLSSVKDVGVWMTLAGYWNSIAPGSPLEKEYSMKRYPLERSNVPGQDWSDIGGFDFQQSGTITDSKGRFYLLPPLERALDFWKGYFTTCAKAGVTFVKVDNQAYGSFLAGVDGGHEFVANWDAMFAAANEVFGPNKVIHCMAHYERTFSGDIGLGIPSEGQRIVVRNSDDFGLNRPNVHRDHIHYNLYNAMLLEQLACIPDTDMFKTHMQWPAYHAVLRAFFAKGPVLVADPPGTWIVEMVRKMIGRDTKGEWELVRANETARPLARNVWERTMDAGPGPSIKAASTFGEHGASILMWNARQDALYATEDVLFKKDVVDALAAKSNSSTYAVWLGETKKATSISLGDTLQSSTTSDPILALSLSPKSVEVMTVVPFRQIAGQDIAVVGLIDKYAGLAAIESTSVDCEKLVTKVRLDGVLGFVLRGNGTSFTATVDGRPVQVQVESIALEKGSNLKLLSIDLTKTEPRDGEKTWTVQLSSCTCK